MKVLIIPVCTPAWTCQREHFPQSIDSYRRVPRTGILVGTRRVQHTGICKRHIWIWRNV